VCRRDNGENRNCGGETVCGAGSRLEARGSRAIGLNYRPNALSGKERSSASHANWKGER